MIITYPMKRFTYETPKIGVNVDTGELLFLEENGCEGMPVQASTFLFRVNSDEAGDVISVDSLDDVNAYILHKSVNEDLKDTRPISRALLNYFQFLEDHSMQWNDIPSRNNKKPTYRYKAYLEACHRSGLLAASTCKSYMSGVVNFYKYNLRRRVQFDNDPMQFEMILVNTQSSYSSIQSSRQIYVNTTDLRLNVSKQTDLIPNKLCSLTQEEQGELRNILLQKKHVIKLDNFGKRRESFLPIEFCLMLLIALEAGLRRNEVNDLKLNQVFKPTTKEMKAGYLDLPIGPQYNSSTKGDKNRVAEIPSALMMLLYQFSISDRRIEREKKFFSHNPEVYLVPLFLNRSGEQYSEKAINSRWSEIRASISATLGRRFNHKVHNLRATYAVQRLKAFIECGAFKSIMQAQVYIQHKLGHSSLSTTEHYLKQAEGIDSGFKASEVTNEFLMETYGELGGDK